jgi:uncharacterized protein YecE (DUF72 family)
MASRFTSNDYTMDPLPKLAHRSDVSTAPFVYIRFLGNRKEIDAAIKQAQDTGLRRREFESMLKDRTGQMQTWIPPLKQLMAKGTPTYIYFNNHYAGYAPGSVELLEKLLAEAL